MIVDEFRQQIGQAVEEYERGGHVPGRTVEIIACKVNEFSQSNSGQQTGDLALMQKTIADWEAKIIDDQDAAERICAIYRTWPEGQGGK
jgi:hypothetical protein